MRLGFTAKYNTLNDAEQDAFPSRQPGGTLGLAANKDTLRWLWENGFAAMASDSPSFERGPQGGSYNEPGVTLHQWCLAGWGLPIGEMFDMEKLAEECKRLKRWTFFVASVPLKVSFPAIKQLMSSILTVSRSPAELLALRMQSPSSEEVGERFEERNTLKATLRYCSNPLLAP